LALTPSLIAARTGTAAWVTAVVLFIVLVTWQRLYHPILLRLLEARELDRPDLAPRFAAIVSKSTASPPRLWVLDPKGGRWANADRAHFRADDHPRDRRRHRSASRARGRERPPRGRALRRRAGAGERARQAPRARAAAAADRCGERGDALASEPRAPAAGDSQ